MGRPRITANRVTRQSQIDLYDYIKEHLGEPQWTAIRTGGRKVVDADFPSDQDREETQRTRSFMFLAIAALAARRSGHHELVVIAENGYTSAYQYRAYRCILNSHRSPGICATNC